MSRWAPRRSAFRSTVWLRSSSRRFDLTSGSLGLGTA
jgi:hypothetical protein